MLLREIEHRSQIGSKLAGCFEDYRHPSYIGYTKEELVNQRLMGLILGYEDLNDHDQLRTDPMHALAAGKKDILGQDRRKAKDLGKALAGHSTLNRMELPAKSSMADTRSCAAIPNRLKLCYSAKGSKRSHAKRERLSWTSMPPTTRFTVVRRAPSTGGVGPGTRSQSPEV